jgi:rfaE bifunctional protein nucleotidyltransferase chain/domain
MNPTKLKIVTRKEASDLRNKWSKEGQRVVFTNGCFDILHLGHIDYLEKARNIGDKLIVGLNTDESVRRLKGEQRPVVDQNSRSRIIAALQFVDMVVLFDEDTPYELIENLKPDILVKGNDYSKSNIVGADIVMENGGNVETIDLVEGHSTTQIINKIQKFNN